MNGLRDVGREVESQNTRLTLPNIAPPLPAIVEIIEKWAYLVVMRPLMHHREAAQQTVKRDERELRQIELMKLSVDRLSHFWVAGQYCVVKIQVHGL